MFRTALAILLLGLLALGVWYGARWMADRDDLHVTIVFRSAGELRPGAPVTAAGATIGRVTRISSLESQEAVSVTIDQEHRNQLMKDSLYAISERDGQVRLEVVNTVAVGPPLEEGAVVHAREDRVTRWIAKHGPEVGALLSRLEGKARKLVEDYESGKLKQELEDYKEKVPEWRKQGDAVLRRNMESITRKVEESEKALRENRRVREADELRKRFEQWRRETNVEQAEENR